MQTKLTLRMDETLIRTGKLRAKRQGKSLSKMIADYLALMERLEAEEGGALPAATRRLQGVLRGTGLDEGDHRVRLDEKHQ